MTGSPAPSICLRRVPWRTALVLLCTAGMWFGGSNRTLAAEVIQSSILVSVSPRMSVQAEGRDIRYGIYRDFPLTFKDANGVIREVDFTMRSLEIDVDVNESYINRVKPGQKVSAVLDAYPDWEIPSHATGSRGSHPSSCWRPRARAAAGAAR